jgi:hypothetical protein
LKTLRAGSAILVVAAAGILAASFAILDTLYVPKDRLLLTLAPQFAGLAAVAVGLALCAMEIFKDTPR